MGAIEAQNCTPKVTQLSSCDRLATSSNLAHHGKEIGVAEAVMVLSRTQTHIPAPNGIVIIIARQAAWG